MQVSRWPTAAVISPDDSPEPASASFRRRYAHCSLASPLSAFHSQNGTETHTTPAAASSRRFRTCPRGPAARRVSLSARMHPRTQSRRCGTWHRVAHRLARSARRRAAVEEVRGSCPGAAERRSQPPAQALRGRPSLPGAHRPPPPPSAPPRRHPRRRCRASTCSRRRSASARPPFPVPLRRAWSARAPCLWLHALLCDVRCGERRPHRRRHRALKPRGRRCGTPERLPAALPERRAQRLHRRWRCRAVAQETLCEQLARDEHLRTKVHRQRSEHTGPCTPHYRAEHASCLRECGGRALPGATDKARDRQTQSHAHSARSTLSLWHDRTACRPQS